MSQSIEPNIAELGNSWLKSHNLDYKLEQEKLNEEIDKALNDYFSKNGGAGKNRPDTKLLLTDKNGDHFPVLIEYKGTKGKLEKLDANFCPENMNISKNTPHFNNINGYAVNGAVHYANAVLHHTSYLDIIAIGMTGYKDSFGKIHHEIGVYYVSKNNLGAGQRVGDYSDFSFLSPKHFDDFIKTVKSLSLSPDELDRLKQQREKEIDASLVKLNNDIYNNEKGLGENDRVYLVAASIMATLGIAHKVKPLEKSELKSSEEQGNRDGDIIVRKIEAFLNAKNIPIEKRDLIVRTLKNTLTTENINKVTNGESQLKRVFTKIVDDLGVYYKIGLTTDFTGKLFNEMYGWLGFSQDKLNDVVLTPSYIATLLVKLARVGKDSYVWDFATGSAGLLVAAMNEMLNDAKQNITSPHELTQKENKIKVEQILGLEILSSVYMLAILNMILMGDGSSNILNQDYADFDGKYGFGQTEKTFPADAFILNPPYSAVGNGMIFVEKALGMMQKGYASIIIQNSAGSGKAKDINKNILKKHTLLASIKMPIDIFIGKSSVQTYIYVFKVSEPHHKDELVKFIDFSDDGYIRTSRKKSNNNLKDVGNAKERYEELVNVVRFGRSKLNLISEADYYEHTIDPLNGADWNQSKPIDTKPTLNDFKKTVSDYMAWEIAMLLKEDLSLSDNLENEINFQKNKISNYTLTDKEKSTLENFKNIQWGEFVLGELFEKIKVKSLRYKTSELPSKTTGDFILPALTAGIQNQGLNNFVPTKNATILENVISISANGANTGATFYQSKKFTVLQDAYAIEYKNKKENLNDNKYIFLTASISKNLHGHYEWTNKAGWERVKSEKICLPVTKNNQIDFDYMDTLISALHKLMVKNVVRYVEKDYL